MPKLFYKKVRRNFASYFSSAWNNLSFSALCRGTNRLTNPNTNPCATTTHTRAVTLTQTSICNPSCQGSHVSLLLPPSTINLFLPIYSNLINPGGFPVGVPTKQRYRTAPDGRASKVRYRALSYSRLGGSTWMPTWKRPPLVGVAYAFLPDSVR